jgi:energy-coupling factor transporter ATP-binding protein EcfA2
VGIDPEARDAIHGLLRRLRALGLAILLTTHDLEQAAELADRLITPLDPGRRPPGRDPQPPGFGRPQSRARYLRSWPWAWTGARRRGSWPFSGRRPKAGAW